MSGIYGEGGRGGVLIIENSYCHCSLVNLKIANNDGRSLSLIENLTLMNLRSERGLKGAGSGSREASISARPVRMTNFGLEHPFENSREFCVKHGVCVYIRWRVSHAIRRGRSWRPPQEGTPDVATSKKDRVVICDPSCET